MGEIKELDPFINVKNIPLDVSSTGLVATNSELQGEIRIGTAIKRLIVLDENNIPVMLMGYDENGF
jgi:hypothetical protein